MEAAETIIFLIEARADLLQGIEIPRDEPSDEKKAEGFSGFLRYACKMATGSGKTTVMGMLAAWSILNKVNNRSDGRFSEVVLIVCPNVTIRDRLRELKPEEGEASIYRSRYLVPGHLLPLLTQGKVSVTNWHVFEPQGTQTGGVTARVNKAGVPQRVTETITIEVPSSGGCRREPEPIAGVVAKCEVGISVRTWPSKVDVRLAALGCRRRRRDNDIPVTVAVHVAGTEDCCKASRICRLWHE